MTALDEVARHVRAHDAEADETDLCHVSESPGLFDVLAALLSVRDA
jgi:hypothetical protein